jgi:AAA+ ATPase superfamily predicted ATPase
MFIDRLEELAFLNQLLIRKKPGPAQLILMYGRRRVGKTVLLNHWAEQSGVFNIYWVADKESPAAQRRGLFARIMGMPEEQVASFDSWRVFWGWFASHMANIDERQILILDEFQYASQADEAMLSALQHTWDQHLKDTNLVIVLCGSQVKTMETIMHHQSPLFGRFTGQWLLEPLSFSALKEFFPSWSPAERVALYAIVGGIPAYLEWLDPERGLSDNIRDIILSPGSMFMAEPTLLLYDELRELSSYLAVLRAISNGHHTLSAISNAALISRTNLTFFLSRLQELRFVERRLPVTLTTAQQRKSKQGRYHLSDPYFRFYFRFLVPHQKSLLGSQQTLSHIESELRAFVGIAFEQLAQQWLVRQAHLGAQALGGSLPFIPEAVGAHWSRKVQVDVVAINWTSRDILLGECKWGADKVSRQVVRDLIERKGAQVRADLPGDDWTLHYALFSRAGCTDAAAAEMEARDGLVVDLSMLDQGLSI